MRSWFKFPLLFGQVQENFPPFISLLVHAASRKYFLKWKTPRRERTVRKKSPADTEGATQLETVCWSVGIKSSHFSSQILSLSFFFSFSFPSFFHFLSSFFLLSPTYSAFVFFFAFLVLLYIGKKKEGKEDKWAASRYFLSLALFHYLFERAKNESVNANGDGGHFRPELKFACTKELSRKLRSAFCRLH